MHFTQVSLDSNASTQPPPSMLGAEAHLSPEHVNLSPTEQSLKPASELSVGGLPALGPLIPIQGRNAFPLALQYHNELSSPGPVLVAPGQPSEAQEPRWKGPRMTILEKPSNAMAHYVSGLKPNPALEQGQGLKYHSGVQGKELGNLTKHNVGEEGRMNKCNIENLRGVTGAPLGASRNLESRNYGPSDVMVDVAKTAIPGSKDQNDVQLDVDVVRNFGATESKGAHRSRHTDIEKSNRQRINDMNRLKNTLRPNEFKASQVLVAQFHPEISKIQNQNIEGNLVQAEVSKDTVKEPAKPVRTNVTRQMVTEGTHTAALSRTATKSSEKAGASTKVWEWTPAENPPTSLKTRRCEGPSIREGGNCQGRLSIHNNPDEIVAVMQKTQVASERGKPGPPRKSGTGPDLQKMKETQLRRKAGRCRNRKVASELQTIQRRKRGRPRKDKEDSGLQKAKQRKSGGRKRPAAVPMRRTVNDEKKIAPAWERPGTRQKAARKATLSRHSGMAGDVKKSATPQAQDLGTTRKSRRRRCQRNQDIDVIENVTSDDDSATSQREERKESRAELRRRKLNHLRFLDIPRDVKILMREVYALRSIIAKHHMNVPRSKRQKEDKKEIDLMNEMRPACLLLQIKDWSDFVESADLDVDANEFFGLWPSNARHSYVQWAHKIYKFLIHTYEDRDSWMSMVLQEDDDQLSVMVKGLLILVRSAKNEGFVPYQELLSYLNTMINGLLQMLDYEADSVLWIQAMTQSVIKPLLTEVKDVSFRKSAVEVCLNHVVKAIEYFSLPSVDTFASGEACEGASTIFDIIPPEADFETRLKPYYPQIKRYCVFLSACILEKVSNKASMTEQQV